MGKKNQIRKRNILRWQKRERNRKKVTFWVGRPNLTVSLAGEAAAATDVVDGGRFLAPFFFAAARLTPADAHWAWTKACR